VPISALTALSLMPLALASAAKDFFQPSKAPPVLLHLAASAGADITTSETRVPRNTFRIRISKNSAPALSATGRCSCHQHG